MDPITLLVVAVVCLAVGYIAATLILSMRSEQKKSTAEPAPAVQPEALPEDARPLDDLEEAARFLRNPLTGHLHIQLGGQGWDEIAQVPAGQRARLEALLDEFRRWMGTYEMPHFAASTTPAFMEEPPAVSPIRPDISASVVAVSSYKPPFVEEKSIVEQIDDILQAQLASSPYAGRTIHLVELPDQAVGVQVDQEKYPGIDTVPDAGIRDLIRQSVTAWEGKKA
ncbi:MAG TPA: hypothetical protein VF813_11395 [Anaerolineaceae bacterium]